MENLDSAEQGKPNSVPETGKRFRNSQLYTYSALGIALFFFFGLLDAILSPMAKGSGGEYVGCAQAIPGRNACPATPPCNSGNSVLGFIADGFGILSYGALVVGIMLLGVIIVRFLLNLFTKSS